MLKRLLDAAQWRDSLSETVDDSIEEVLSSFADEPAIVEVTKDLNDSWHALYNRSRFKNVKLELETQTLQDFVSTFTAYMQTGADDEVVPVDRLSDGLRSLLYFAIVETAFKVEQRALDSEADSEFDVDMLNPPQLTVFLIEEPETHLAPHLLGKVLGLFRDLAESPRCQATFSSHSPSVVHRIEPEEIRHLQLDSDGTSQVSRLTLPDDGTEADKFVRQAVRAYPELYFARMVVLGEGDSEEVVLGQLLDANDLPSDPNVISVVPLGGRHVNHLWRLLQSLSIPYVTLLDLDLERKGGGWGRIHYVCNQLIESGVPKKKVIGDMSDEEFDDLPNHEVDDEELGSWISDLEEFRIFFSNPLDLDYSMLVAFADNYRATSEGKPQRFSSDEKAKQLGIARLVRAVFGKSVKTVKTYSEDTYDFLRWYRYLFIKGSKPAYPRLGARRYRKR